MWSFMQHSRPGPFAAGQKREFGLHLRPEPSIMPEKLFQNPNFVNNHPHFENPASTMQSVMKSVLDKCHTDINKGYQSFPKNNSVPNSSRSILHALKKNQMDVLRDPGLNSNISNSSVMRGNRRRKATQRSAKFRHRQTSPDLMEVDSDSEPDMNTSNILTSPKATMLRIADFIVNIPCTSSDNENISDEEDSVTVISISPSNKCQLFTREQQLSATDSEDDDDFIVFECGAQSNTESDDDSIVFENGNDDEFSEEEKYEKISNQDDSEIEDDFDSSSSSAVPCKRVRFAAKEDLCQIYPMVQWSFAYRKARKGPWEEYARDRCRFNKRISDMEKILAPIFDCKHREKMYKERFQNERTD